MASSSSTSVSVPTFVSPDHPMEHFFTSEGESRFVDLEFEKENEVATALVRKADGLVEDLRQDRKKSVKHHGGMISEDDRYMGAEDKAYMARAIKEIEDKVIPLYKRAIEAGSHFAHQKLAMLIHRGFVRVKRWNPIADEHFSIAVFSYMDITSTMELLIRKLYQNAVLPEEFARCARQFLRLFKGVSIFDMPMQFNQVVSCLRSRIVSSDYFVCYHVYLSLVENGLKEFYLPEHKEAFATFRQSEPELFAQLSQYYKDEVLIRVIDALDRKEYESSKEALCKLAFDLQKIPSYFLEEERKKIQALFISFMKEGSQQFSQIFSQLGRPLKDIEGVMGEKFAALFAFFAALYASIDRVSNPWQAIEGVSGLVAQYAASEEFKELPEVITASIIEKECIAKAALPAAENWLQQVVDGLHGYSVFSSSGSSAFEKRHFLRDCSYTEELDKIKQLGMSGI